MAPLSPAPQSQRGAAPAPGARLWVPALGLWIRPGRHRPCPVPGNSPRAWGCCCQPSLGKLLLGSGIPVFSLHVFIERLLYTKPCVEGAGEMGVKETEDKGPVLLEFTIQCGKQTVKAIHQVTHTLWNGL